MYAAHSPGHAVITVLKRHPPFALMTPSGITSVMQGHAFVISRSRDRLDNEFEKTPMFQLVILFRETNL